MSQSKYAIAQINIPIELLPNGEWTNYNDRISIQIIRTNELPPISTIDGEKLQETIREILGSTNTPTTKIPFSFSVDSESPLLVKHAPIEDTIPSPPPQTPPPVEYIDREALLARQRRPPSKNTSFKHAPYKSHNKTKHNRWSNSR